jgi:long-chain acyl-CoA synthetase
MTSTEVLIKQLLFPMIRPESVQKKEAIIHDYEEGKAKYTYQALSQLIDQAQYALIKKSVKKGDLVLTCAPNSAGVIATIIACWRLGAIACPVDFRITDGEFENLAKRLNVKAIYAPTRENVIKQLDLEIPQSLSESEHLELNKINAEIKLSSENPALIILTSGTTGEPKGALHDLGSLVTNTEELSKMATLSETSQVVLPLPVSHVIGLEVAVVSLLVGGCLILTEFMPQALFTAIFNYQPDFIIGVPTIYSMLIAAAEKLPKIPAMPRLCVSGGAPLPESLAQEFQDKFQRKICQGYGLTETKIVSLNTQGPVLCVGKTVPSAQIDIVDSKDQALPEGQSGEVRISGKTIMLGYYKQPELTEKVIKDNYYYTGDIGYLKDGNLYINGRSKEMIIVAGHKIFPMEVESILRNHSLTQEVAVIGVPHSRLGQMVKAIVVVKDSPESIALKQANGEIEEIRKELANSYKQYCKDNLKRELRPMEWDFRATDNPLPKTLSGKIDKKQLV